MALAHYILFSIVATVFGAMFLLIGSCFLYVCFLTLRGHPGADDEISNSTRSSEVSFVPRQWTPPPLRHFLVINPEGNPLFGYRLSDIKSTCASFKSSVVSSFRQSFGRRADFGGTRLDIEQGVVEEREVVNPLVELGSRSSKELGQDAASPRPIRPQLADIREWRTM